MVGQETYERRKSSGAYPNRYSVLLLRRLSPQLLRYRGSFFWQIAPRDPIPSLRQGMVSVRGPEHLTRIDGFIEFARPSHARELRVYDRVLRPEGQLNGTESLYLLARAWGTSRPFPTEACCCLHSLLLLTQHKRLTHALNSLNIPNGRQI